MPSPSPESDAAGSDPEVVTSDRPTKRPRTALLSPRRTVTPLQGTSHLDRAFALGSAIKGGAKITQLASQLPLPSSKKAIPIANVRTTGIPTRSKPAASSAKGALRKVRPWTTSDFADASRSQPSSPIQAGTVAAASPSRVSLSSLHGDPFALLDDTSRSQAAGTEGNTKYHTLTARLPFAALAGKSLKTTGPTTPITALPTTDTRLGGASRCTGDQKPRGNSITAVPQSLGSWAITRGSPESPLKPGKGLVKNALAERAAAILKNARTAWVMWDYEQTHSANEGNARGKRSAKSATSRNADIVFRLDHVFPPAASQLSSVTTSTNETPAFSPSRCKPSQVIAICTEESVSAALPQRSGQKADEESTTDLPTLVVFSSALAGSGAAGQSAFVGLDKLLAKVRHRSLERADQGAHFLSFDCVSDMALKDNATLRVAAWDPLYELALDADQLGHLPLLPSPRPTRTILCSRFVVLP